MNDQTELALLNTVFRVLRGTDGYVPPAIDEMTRGTAQEVVEELKQYFDIKLK